jgi:hypothetical protein
MIGRGGGGPERLEKTRNGPYSSHKLLVALTRCDTKAGILLRGWAESCQALFQPLHQQPDAEREIVVAIGGGGATWGEGPQALRVFRALYQQPDAERLDNLNNRVVQAL